MCVFLSFLSSFDLSPQRTLTILCTQDIHRALSRPLSYSLSYSLTHALTRSPRQDEECVSCTDSGEKCQACAVTKANDYYVDYYVDYYAKYFEKVCCRTGERRSGGGAAPVLDAPTAAAPPFCSRSFRLLPAVLALICSLRG
jgi:hypothetical protein